MPPCPLLAQEVFQRIDEAEAEYRGALQQQNEELQKKRQEFRQRRQERIQQTETKAMEMKRELMKDRKKQNIFGNNDKEVKKFECLNSYTRMLFFVHLLVMLPTNSLTHPALLLPEELEAVHEELKRAKEEIHCSVKEQVVLRQQVLKSVDQDIHRIDLAVNQGLEAAKTRARDLQQRAQEIIQEVQQRDFAMEEQLRRRVSTAMTVLDMAKTAKDSASTEHVGNEQRRRNTAKAFGDVFPRSNRFDLVGLSTAKPRTADPDGRQTPQTPRRPSR